MGIVQLMLSIFVKVVTGVGLSFRLSVTNITQNPIIRFDTIFMTVR